MEQQVKITNTFMVDSGNGFSSCFVKISDSCSSVITWGAGWLGNVLPVPCGQTCQKSAWSIYQW